MKLSLSDASGAKNKSLGEWNSAQDVEAWVRANAGANGFFDTFLDDNPMDNDGVRFSISNGVASAIFSRDTGCELWTLMEGDPSADDIDVPNGGSTTAVIGSEQISLDRLIEVLTYCLESGHRIPGKWERLV